ncbi:uncharacterized protein LOC117302220 [Asterias rubens]|uniref:uncharacterized protein LOC117302220 n=1 Tax=Asterias rubens TaxID=7604 RepID=UPI001454FC3F|nr:uncharacterized protein LOC117302220 [Asterias rubens]
MYNKPLIIFLQAECLLMLFHHSLSSSLIILSSNFKDSDSMDGRMSMYVLLVCVWCSLDSGGLLMVVTAQPTVSAEILTPEADRKLGGQIIIRCTATNLESDHIVEWSTFDICYVRRIDHPLRQYVDVEGTSEVILSSPQPYPECSPSGAIAVDTGTELPLRCLSETGNPADITRTNPITDYSSYPWTSSSVDGEDTLSLNLTVTVADDGVAFNCSVLQGSGASMTRSCIIGPISVASSTDATNEITSIKPETTQPNQPHPPTQTLPNQTPSFNLWIVITLSVSTIIIILGVFQIFKMRHIIKSLRKTEASQVPKADPYMELQPTEDKNKVYMEPTTATTTTQDTYYQPVEVETDSHEYDYARPEGSTNTDYEAVRQPPSSAERPYQNLYN